MENNETLKYMTDNLTKENMILRRDGTRLKLVLLQIIEDLEKEEGNEKYVKWIKENCNLKLYHSIDIKELEEINRKRTYDYIHKQQIVEDCLRKAVHTHEYYGILRLSKVLGIDISRLEYD